MASPELKDILSLLGLEEPPRATPRRVENSTILTPALEFCPRELRLRRVSIRQGSAKNGMVQQLDHTWSSLRFLAPELPGLAEELESILGQVKLVREQAEARERALLTKAFELLAEARKVKPVE